MHDQQLLKHIGNLYKDSDIAPGLSDLLEKLDADEKGRAVILQLAGLLKEEITRRKIAEQLAVPVNTQEVFYSIDMVDYRIAQISDSCKTVYGYTAAEFFENADLWLDVILPEDRHIIFGNQEIMYTGRSFSQEYRIRHGDGSIRWMESKLSPTLDANGKLVRLDGTTADITKRKEAELALKDSETKFRYLIDNCADAILIRNEDKEIVYCSDSVHRVIGYKAEEVIGQKTLNDIYPDDLHIVLEHWDRVLENPGVPITITYRRIHKDGHCIWCEGTSVNMLAQPEIRGVVVNFRDVTEKKEAELALKVSESKFRHMISHGADAIMIMDIDLKAVYVSDSVEQITGFAPAEILGRQTSDVIHPDDRDYMALNWEALEKNPNKPLHITYRRKKKDGNYIWCEGTGINLLHNPEVAGYLINFRDITERKNSEDALKRSNDELQKSNAELDRFVYSVSHDLRAPLTSMLGLTLLAKNETEDRNMLDYLDMLQASIGKLDGFIHDILDHSRNARIEIRRQPINFGELLADITANLKFMNPDTPVNIRTHIDEAVAYHSDKSRVGIILNNLVSNAIRYYNPGAELPYVDITVTPEGGNIKLLVKDNGIGINADQQSRVFEMFYRVSHKSAGSGLGLYIVKETVDKLGGEIRLESVPQQGTCFTILLPNMK